MEHGWLVSGAHLIDPTLVLSLAPDLAVFFSPGRRRTGLRTSFSHTFAFLGSARTGWGTQDSGRPMKLPQQRASAAVAGVFFNSVRRSVCKADTRTCREVAGSEKGILPF